MRDRGGGRAGWMGEWEDEKRREWGWMDGEVGIRKEKGVGRGGGRSGMRERRRGWLDAGVG